MVPSNRSENFCIEGGIIMNQDKAWEKFEKTGKIIYYLEYKKNILASGPNIFKGETDENKYKRSSG